MIDLIAWYDQHIVAICSAEPNLVLDATARPSRPQVQSSHDLRTLLPGVNTY